MPIVPPYTGQNQPQQIATPLSPPAAQGPNAVPPYPSGPQGGTDVVPPPIQSTDLWKAMQTWPL
jgi:hypothetical protein